MSVTIQLANNGIQYMDSDESTSPFVKSLVGILFQGTYGAIVNGISVDAAGVTLSLPGSPVQAVFIRNNSTVGGAGLKITVTVVGGTPEEVDILDPGGVFMRISPSSDSGGGYTAITLAGVNGTATAEYILVA